MGTRVIAWSSVTLSGAQESCLHEQRGWSTDTGGAAVGTQGELVQSLCHRDMLMDSSTPHSQETPENQRPQASTRRSTGQTGSHTFSDFLTDRLMDGRAVAWDLRQELAGFLRSQVKENCHQKEDHEHT